MRLHAEPYHYKTILFHTEHKSAEKRVFQVGCNDLPTSQLLPENEERALQASGSALLGLRIIMTLAR